MTDGGDRLWSAPWIRQAGAAGGYGRDDAASTASREEAEERELNRLGAGGWELVWVVSAMHETSPGRLYLKRARQNGAS